MIANTTEIKVIEGVEVISRLTEQYCNSNEKYAIDIKRHENNIKRNLLLDIIEYLIENDLAIFTKEDNNLNFETIYKCRLVALRKKEIRYLIDHKLAE